MLPLKNRSKIENTKAVMNRSMITSANQERIKEAESDYFA